VLRKSACAGERVGDGRPSDPSLIVVVITLVRTAASDFALQARVCAASIYIRIKLTIQLSVCQESEQENTDSDDGRNVSRKMSSQQNPSQEREM
jgi:hypothetical protein